MISLNQAEKNYNFHAISDLIIIEDIIESITLGLIYGLKLDNKKTLLDRGVDPNDSLWTILRY